MKELGLENPIGVPTEEGKNLLIDHLYQENREALKAKVAPLYEEEKAKK
jgi:hypothetical protein